MDERKRDSMIAYLRHRMEEFGIKPEDLAALPRDGASQIDHYIYGIPKREL